MRYIWKTGNWRKGTATYVFREVCATCGRPFLARVGNKGVVCCLACRQGEFTGNWRGGLYADKAAYMAKYREENAEVISAQKAKYYQENGEVIRTRVSQYQRENRDKCNALHAARRARLRGQTPEDASKEKMEWFFKVAAAMTEATGQPYHVDHIHPISAGGLHHEGNLQVLNGQDNLKKHAKVGVEPTGVTIEVYYTLMDAFDFLSSIACPEQ
jgi:hypothetical protein